MNSEPNLVMKKLRNGPGFEHIKNKGKILVGIRRC